MNAKTTWFWTVLAAGLFAFIFLFERHIQPPEPGPGRILPTLDARAVTSIAIVPKGQLEIRADRTNGQWQLTRPVQYPALDTAVDSLLATLEQLTPATFISAQELRHTKQVGEKFGFDPPETSIVIEQGDEQTFIHVGRRTGPGHQFYLQVVGVGDIYIVDAALLGLIPRNVDAWRDTALVDIRRFKFNRLLVTNAGKAFELHWNATNKLWRLLLPGWEPRADNTRVEQALQRLQELRVEQFVTDDPRADLDALKLQDPELSLALAYNTNPPAVVLAFGGGPTNNPARIYARRNDEHSVVSVSHEALGSWAYDYFRDRHLVTLTAPLDAIEIRGSNTLSLRRQTDRSWRILPQNWPADAALVNDLITNLTALQVTEFLKDVVTAPDLAAKGLATPHRQVLLMTDPAHTPAGSTNPIMTQLDFGTNQDDQVFACRPDETSLYTVKASDLGSLPTDGWQLRDRRIGRFTEDDVARIVIQQRGKTRVIVRDGPNRWSLAPGSQGVINDLALDEVAHRLGALEASAWLGWGEVDRAAYGFTAEGHSVTVELKDGRKLGIEFGGVAASGYPCALTMLEGQAWMFEFPWALYQQFVKTYLTIPDYIR